MSVLSFDEYMRETMTGQNPWGSYIGVQWDRKHCRRLLTALQGVVPDDKLINVDDMHTTLIYSRVNIHDEYTSAAPEDVGAVGKAWEWFGPETDCLVLLLDCPWLVNRHRTLMDTTNAVFDYDQYKPHITVAYNLDRDQIGSLPSPKQFDFRMEREYYEQLDTGKFG